MTELQLQKLITGLADEAIKALSAAQPGSTNYERYMTVAEIFQGLATTLYNATKKTQ